MINKISSKRTYIVFIAFSICMIVLGASDSLRGIFSIVFQDYYELSTTQLSMIVTISYLGNLVFLLCGGNFLDRFNKKYVFKGKTNNRQKAISFLIIKVILYIFQHYFQQLYLLNYRNYKLLEHILLFFQKYIFQYHFENLQ